MLYTAYVMYNTIHDRFIKNFNFRR